VKRSKGQTDQATVGMFAMQHLTDLVPAGSVLRLFSITRKQHSYSTQYNVSVCESAVTAEIQLH